MDTLPLKPTAYSDLARPDGRPEAYAVPREKKAEGFRAPCALCSAEGKLGVRYSADEIFMCSPIDSSDGQSHLVCLGHLPDDVVIYDPSSNTCRNKDGTEVWQELEPGVKKPYTGKVAS